MSRPVPPLLSPRAPIVAWLDESRSNHELDPNTYLIAAAICFQEHVDDARALMAGLKKKAERKIHWRDDDDKRHLEMTQAIAGMEAVEHVVVVRSRPEDPADTSERRRRKCLERILFELTSMEVGHAILESRGPADDKRDMDMLGHLRRTRALPGKIYLDHTPGPLDPLLWVPDAVCGAVSESRWGEEIYLRELETRVTLHEI